MSSIYIFNQYYIDFLKKIKSIAKKHKDDSKTARNILALIKQNYQTLDKSSDEYLLFVNKNITDDLWKSFINLPNDEKPLTTETSVESTTSTESTIETATTEPESKSESATEPEPETEPESATVQEPEPEPATESNWFEDNGDIEIFIGIKIKDIVKLLQDEYLCYHYISVFYIFRKEYTLEESTKIIKILQSINTSDLINDIEDVDVKYLITKLQNMRNKKIKDSSGIDMSYIEDTTIGKIAKEILDDIDISKLQKSMGDDGNILNILGNPDSGFSDIITNVSKKIATKISNGELKQENLMQDAFKFASMMGNNSGNSSTSSSGGSGMPDMANMMSMMGSLFGGGAGGAGGGGGGGRGNNMGGFDELFKSAMKDNKKSGAKTTINKNALKKMSKSIQLKKKLNEKRNNM